ncbi:MAG: tRNA pseudouridine(55) synthase TruB [Ruminococcaceae bacterium]|nr:tRNA pseudouridine(55) synthase TruB [Oscillospiraceae bacterium]
MSAKLRSEIVLGIINLYKPAGKTSHDMVSFVRKTLGIKKVGHTGTLDPCAEGVLPILVGRATALSDYLMAGDKIYTATVKLGIITDTYDTTGTILKENTPCVSLSDIKKAAAKFIGEIQQEPPMYSAIKIGGRKLYQLAREGKEIERPKRNITIFDISVLNFDEEKNEFKMRVHCSKGTYIRSLCHDLGLALGCGAAMDALVRNKTGIFDDSTSKTCEMINQSVNSGDFSFIIAPDKVLCEFPSVTVDDETSKKVQNGLMLRINQLGINLKLGEKIRIYDKERFLCLAKIVESEGALCIKIDMGFY